MAKPGMSTELGVPAFPGLGQHRGKKACVWGERADNGGGNGFCNIPAAVPKGRLAA